MWYLIERGGTGCDYSIGCGVTATKLVAQNPQDARDEAVKKLGLFSDDEGERRWRSEESMGSVSEAVLLEVEREINLGPYLDELIAHHQTLRDAEVVARREANERAEYERLKRKFGGERC